MSSRTDRGRSGRRPPLLLAIAIVLALGLTGGLDGGGQSAAATSPAGHLPVARTVASTSTTTALTLNQWKQRYQSVITRLVDDALTVVKDGAVKSGADRSQLAAEVKRTMAACNTWRVDAQRALGQAPAIPLAAAQATWRQLVAASGRAASDCWQVLTTRNPSKASDFRAQVALVYGAEGRLTSELSGAG
jgi:hypothetical protein